MWLISVRIRFPNIIDEKGKDLTIVHVSKVRTESSFKTLMDTAEIVIPRNVKLFDKYKVRELFRANDPVIIELGYDGEMEEEFAGYIAHVSADIPIIIKCEDEMRMVKKMPVNYSNKSVTLEKLLKDICPGYDIDALEGVRLGSVRFSKTTVGQVLGKLQSDFNLYTYMKGKQIICGKYYADDSSVPEVEFDLDRQIVENNLQYKNKEDVVLKIDAQSITVNGEKIEFSFGEEGGSSLRSRYFNIETKAQLERKVKDDYAKAHRDGWDGGFKGFGRPRIQHGWKAKLKSQIYPDRVGSYYIESVVKEIDENSGYRQDIKLGGKVN